MDSNLQKVIAAAIDRTNELLPAGAGIANDPATVLLGESGCLDSMGFVNFQFALEEELDRQLGIQVILADELAAEKNLSTIGDLQNVLARLAVRKKS